MKGFRNKIFQRVLGIHAGVLFLMIVIPWLRGCFRRPPKPIEIQYVDLVPMRADLSAAPAPQPEPAPAPAPTPPPTPAPAPKPPPQPKPEPAPAPKPEPAPKPAWKPAPVVRQDTVVQRPAPQSEPQPRQPTIDPSRVRSALEQVASGAVNPLAAYYEQVRIRLYEVWQPPAGVPLGLTASAQIRVEADGSISSKSISRRSGHAAFDQSVQDALNRVTRLPRPPAELPDRTIHIEFDLN